LSRKINFLEDTFVPNFFHCSSTGGNFLVLGLAAATVAPLTISSVVLAQNNAADTLANTNYSDVSADFRARPLMEALGESNIIAQTGNDIVSVAAASDSFKTLTSLLKTAGLADTLQQPGPYTVFAPTDQAFATLPPGVIEQLQQPENRELLIQILSYHVVSGRLTANQLTSGELKTVENTPVNIKVDTATNQVTVNEAAVTQPNIQASNGVIHAINQVLIPPSITGGQQPQTNQPQPQQQAQAPGDAIAPGRATRGGASYVGVAGNIGIGGDTALGESNFAVISKIGLTPTISVRPSALFGDDTVFLVPLTYDFAPRAVDPAGVPQFAVSPYVGAGVAVEIRDITNLGLLLTGGVDVPLAERLTLTSRDA
jgi:uncharacterized surface protein with fasciclin (FAS1) repeats